MTAGKLLIRDLGIRGLFNKLRIKVQTIATPSKFILFRNTFSIILKYPWKFLGYYQKIFSKLYIYHSTFRTLSLKIKRNIDLNYINDLYKIVNSSTLAQKILVPKSIDKTSFGAIPSLIQFFANLIREDKCSQLVLPYSSAEKLESYIEVEFVYPFIVLAWNLKISNENGNDLKPELSSISQRYFSKLEFLKVKVLRSLPIYSFDHDTTQRGLSRYFYDQKFKLVSLDQLEFNLHPIFKKLSLAHNRSDSNKSIAPIIANLSEIIFELFKNTHEHGRTKISGGYLFPNLRNATLRTIRRKKSAYLADKQLPVSIKEYFQNNLPLTEQSDFIMLEISILDSGPGLVCRYSNIDDLNSLTISEEVTRTRECLLKHRTSSNAFLSSIKGQGLDKVMQLLDGKGFLRIKTGRLDLFRNFISDPYKETSDVNEVVLKDYMNNSIEYTEYPQTVGTLHTFYYPIGEVI